MMSMKMQRLLLVAIITTIVFAFVIPICKLLETTAIGSIFEKKEYSATLPGTASSYITNSSEVEAGISFVCIYLEKSKQRVYIFSGVTLWNGDQDYILEHSYNASLDHDNEIKPYYPNTVFDENGVEWKIQISK